MATAQSNNRLAVLIDADNAQPSVIEGLLAEVAKLGVASVKRIYGDWTSTGTTQWKQSLLRYSITPVQQFAYTKGKNATDASLIIDAMDLMHTHRFGGFCLVSSDSDFTALARRLREEGLVVYGFGEKKTPDAFVAACDKFIYTEVLRPTSGVAEMVTAEPPRPPKQKEAPDSASPAEPAAAVASGKPAEPQPVPLDLIRQAIEEESDDSGWAHLGAVGSYIQRIRADFDSRLYGSKKLSELLKRYPKHFVIEERSAPGSSSKAIFVRKPTI
jgi:hypothetical protein